MEKMVFSAAKAFNQQEWHNAVMNFKSQMSYGDYLMLDMVLNAQKPLSPDHNEMLFIIQHQISELWMKLILTELHAARQEIIQDEVHSALKVLCRVTRILEQMVQAWNVLITMTPSEYSGMRPYLGASSGFQSYQYREIEFLLGNKNAALLRPHAHKPELFGKLSETLQSPSLYDETIRLMHRKGMRIDEACVNRDWSQPTTCSASIEDAWLKIYHAPKQYWELYLLGEKLIDLEDLFRQWRFRHVTTVERLIGFKKGTGGTEGVGYLRKMLEVVLFPELWKVRSDM